MTKHRICLCIVLSVLLVLVFPVRPMSQPAPPAPLKLGPDFKIDSLTGSQCLQLKNSPATCQDGFPPDQCQITKERVATKCAELSLSFATYVSVFLDNVRDKIFELLLAIAAAAGALASGWLNHVNSKLRRTVSNLKVRIVDPFFERPDAYRHFATNMVLIGEGGSGKTTIVHALTGSDRVHPDISTNEMSTYTLVNEMTIEKKDETYRRLARIYTDDYVGQNWTQGALNEKVKLRQDFVKSTTLVIVVDLVKPGSSLDPAKPQEKIDKSRVKYQNNAYGDQSIQTLSRLLGDKGQIVLFINKFDLIEPRSGATREEAIRSYGPLIERLEHLRGVRLSVIVGSAFTGSGIVGYDGGVDAQKSLYKLVLDHCDEVGPDLMKALSDAVR